MAGPEQRTALVTGTAQGIGAAIADALRAEGLRVHGVDKDECDVTDPGAVAWLVHRIGRVDVLVNCAGGVVGQVGKPLEVIQRLFIPPSPCAPDGATGTSPAEAGGGPVARCEC